MELTDISNTLQNPSTEVERMGAWSALVLYLDENPADAEAIALYDKYHVLQREWTTEVVSI